MRVEAPTGEPSPGKRYGIAIVANDKIADWLLPFLESYHATNAATPLYLIPYDDNVAITRRAAAGAVAAARRGNLCRRRRDPVSRSAPALRCAEAGQGRFHHRLAELRLCLQ